MKNDFDYIKEVTSMELAEFFNTSPYKIINNEKVWLINNYKELLRITLTIGFEISYKKNTVIVRKLISFINNKEYIDPIIKSSLISDYDNDIETTLINTMITALIEYKDKCVKSTEDTNDTSSSKINVLFKLLRLK